MVVGVDCKRVEFNLLRGVKSIVSVALDVESAANIIETFRTIMMNRFKMMEENNVNNIYKVENRKVNYYSLWGNTYQFDELFEVTQDIDKTARNYEKLLGSYPDGRIPCVMSIEDLYEKLETGELRNPELQQRKGYLPQIKKGDIEKVGKQSFKPKCLLLLADEMNELMSGDWKAVDSIKESLKAISRLGRAAAVHLVLACQRASNDTIPSELKNNIQQSLLLGAFDSGISSMMFEKDITNLQKPEIKGRGFMQSGNDIIEVQTFYTIPENDWVFDEDLLLTYNNPVFTLQKKNRDEEIDETGFIFADSSPSTNTNDEENKEDEIRHVIEDDENSSEIYFDEDEEEINESFNSIKTKSSADSTQKKPVDNKEVNIEKIPEEDKPILKFNKVQKEESSEEKKLNLKFNIKK